MWRRRPAQLDDAVEVVAGNAESARAGAGREQQLVVAEFATAMQAHAAVNQVERFHGLAGTEVGLLFEPELGRAERWRVGLAAQVLLFDSSGRS